MLTEAERRRVLVEWNDTRTDFPRTSAPTSSSRPRLSTPDAIAVQMGEDSLTYRQLDSRANQLAWHLRSLGVGPDVRVGLCVERSLHLVVGILGILKAGGVYVLLDPSYPPSAWPSCCATRAPSSSPRSTPADELPIQSELLVLLDAGWDRIAVQPEQRPTRPFPRQPRLRHLHLGLHRHSQGHPAAPPRPVQHRPGLHPDTSAHPADRVLQFAAFSFDTSVSDFFRTLLSGARLVLATREQILGPVLHELMEAQGVTTAILTPSVLAQLEPDKLPTLRTVISAGEACTPQLVERWQPGRHFLNEYGPTEITVCATIDTEVSARLTIGRALPNTQVFVLDSRLQPVPVGVPVSSSSVAPASPGRLPPASGAHRREVRPPPVFLRRRPPLPHG